MDSGDCEVASLRARFHRAAKIAAAEFALRWFDQSTQTARSITKRSPRCWRRYQRGILRTGWPRHRHGNSTRNRPLDCRGNSAGLRRRFRGIVAWKKDLGPRVEENGRP